MDDETEMFQPETETETLPMDVEGASAIGAHQVVGLAHALVCMSVCVCVCVCVCWCWQCLYAANASDPIGKIVAKVKI